MDTIDLRAIYGEVLRAAATRPALADLLDLRGRVAVVTSGGGAGLGQACCHRLAAQGASVHVNDLHGDAAKAVAEDVAERWGVPTSWSGADATDRASVERVVRETIDRHGQIDILVNSVGGFVGSLPTDDDRERDSITSSMRAPFHEQSWESISSVLDSTLWSTVLFTRAVLPLMVERRTGVIVNISSEAARLPAGTAMYGSAKAAINALTAKLGNEVGRLGVRVNTVSPGYIASERVERVLDEQDGKPTTYAANALAGINRTALGRPSQPEEVADVVVFLCSDAAAYVQGSVWQVAGGLA